MRSTLCDAIAHVYRQSGFDSSLTAWHLDLHQVEMDAYLKKLRIGKDYKMSGHVEFELGTSLASLETSVVAQTWISCRYAVANTAHRLRIRQELVEWELAKAYSHTPRKPKSHMREPKLWRYWF